MPTMPAVEQRSRKTEKELTDLMTWKGLLQWEGLKPFDNLGRQKRYEWKEQDIVSAAERIEAVAYDLVQSAYIVGTSVGLAFAL